jgi:methylthioribose-1-phosphate isomerase
MKDVIKPLYLENEVLYVLDQKKLPLIEDYVTVSTVEGAFAAIQEMVVRGAPLIGITALWGMAFWMKNHPNGTVEELTSAGEYLKTSRPTAVNLEYEVTRSVKIGELFHKDHGSFSNSFPEMVEFILTETSRLAKSNLQMAQSAREFLDKYHKKDKYKILTVCNTGNLACGERGTALGAIKYLNDMKRLDQVWVCETRPYLQGARLTSYELVKEGIPHKIIVEGALANIMKSGEVDAVFIGADRIVSNGDTANKIGSATAAIVAKFFEVPFFVLAPSSSFDLTMNFGEEIKIEIRDEEEILSLKDKRIAPHEAHAYNPSFDVTSRDNITAIFCEKGTVHPVNASNVMGVLQ